MRILLLGVPGVGKSYVLSLLSEKIKDYTVINLGNYVFEEARSEFGIKTRDEIREKVKKREYQKLQKRVFKKLESELQKENVIIDTHPLVRCKDGYLFGLPMFIAKNLTFDYVVYLTAKPREIWLRRKRDLGKRKRSVSMNEIKEHLELNKFTSLLYAFFLSANFVVIENRQGRAEECAEKLSQLL